MKRKKILLVQFESIGDCLMTTAIARQIKNDFPGCYLTWAIKEKCKHVILNNPYVDNIWPIANSIEKFSYELITKEKNELLKKIKEDLYDEVFYTQICSDNLHHYDGTTRSSTFRGYPHKITVPISPIIALDNHEVEKVKQFIELNFISSYKSVILIECAPSSGQSLFNMESGLIIAQRLIEENKDTICIISTHISFNSPNPRIIDGSKLSYRENAELSKYCTFLLGCSSGITWLLTSDWAKKIPTVQILNPQTTFFQFASVKYDFQYWKLNHDHIIEITCSEIDKILEVLTSALTNFQQASLNYNEKLTPKISSLNYNIEYHLHKRKFVKAIKTFFYFLNRNEEKSKIISKVFTHFLGILYSKITSRG